MVPTSTRVWPTLLTTVGFLCQSLTLRRMKRPAAEAQAAMQASQARRASGCRAAARYRSPWMLLVLRKDPSSILLRDH